MRYIVNSWPSALPTIFFVLLSFAPAPFLLGDSGLADKGQLDTTDDSIVLLVSQLTSPPPPDSQRPVGCAACLLNDEPVRIYVPLLMLPWVMQACHSTASCHLGTTRTLRMLECFH